MTAEAAAEPSPVGQLVARLLAEEPATAAAALVDLPWHQAVVVLKAQPARLVARLLELQAPNNADRIFALAEASWQVELLELASDRLGAGLLAALDVEAREVLLRGLSAGRARQIREILDYPLGVAGRLMDTRFSRFSRSDTVAQALERLRGEAPRRITDLLLLDQAGKLDAVLPLHVAAAAKLDARLGELNPRAGITVQLMAAKEDVVELAEKYRLSTVAVVDFEGVVRGVIRYDELLEAAREEAAGDALAMVGASREERALASPLAAIRSRLPWLQINLLTAFLASAVVGLFDQTIAQVTALAVLMPVVAGQSGNTGAQALAVTQRGLALKEVRTSQLWRLAGKEALVGLGAGVAVALVTGAGVYSWSRQPMLALVISVAMVCSMTLAAVAGAVIPVVLTVLGRDPATASSIILTTVTDIVGFGSYLGLATALMAWLV